MQASFGRWDYSRDSICGKQDGDVHPPVTGGAGLFWDIRFKIGGKMAT